MSHWTYQQSTGNLYNPSGSKVAAGYSGYGNGKNNPAKDHLKNIGPCPRGLWVMGLPYNSQRIGPYSIPLYQHNHDSKGRDYFRIHGDSSTNPGNASLGCIILPRRIRQKIHLSNCKLLMVIE